MTGEAGMYGCPVCGYEQGGDMTAGDAAKFIVSGCEPDFVRALLIALAREAGAVGVEIDTSGVAWNVEPTGEAGHHVAPSGPALVILMEGGDE